MAKLFLVLVILLGTNFSFGQTKDQLWLDSLQAVLNKIDPEGKYNDYPQMKKFISTNLLLGEYYEKLFTKNELPDLKKALTYYRNITDLSVFPDKEKYYPLMATRNNLSRKLSNIYFFGKGITADRAKALELAVKGMGTNKELFKLYSNRFYNCECIILNKAKNFPATDSAFTLKVNPLAFPVIEFLPLNDKQFTSVAKNFKSSKKFSKGYIYIDVYATATMNGDFYAETLMEKLKDYFAKNAGIDPEKILYSQEYATDRVNVVEIRFKTNKEELVSH